MLELIETHAPTLSSWVESANLPGADFPIQNLPFAVFRRAGSGEAFRGGVAIGSQIVDLGLAAQCGAPGNARIGFGECRGTVLPARGVSLKKVGEPELATPTYIDSAPTLMGANPPKPKSSL